MTSQRRPTSQDVARLSGVSQPVVSYVFNDTPGKSVSPETRKRVLAAASELGFVPSKAAQNLRRGRSSVVVLDAPPGPETTIGPIFFAALSERLQDAGWTIVSHFAVSNSRADHLNELVRATQADAILTAYPDDGRYDKVRASGVRVHPLIAESDLQNVVVPLREQLEHLVGTGRTHLGYIAPDTEDERHVSGMRLRAARDWVSDRGLPTLTELTWAGDLDRLESDLAASLAGGLQGLAAHNDAVAMPVLAATYALGVRIPEQLAVIGVDDAPLAKVSAPPLTTVQWGFDEASMDAFARRIVRALTTPGEVESTQEMVPHVRTVRRRTT